MSRPERDPRIGDGPYGRPVHDVIPDEKPGPAAILRCGGQLGQHARIGELAEWRDIYGMFHPAEPIGGGPAGPAVTP